MNSYTKPSLYWTLLEHEDWRLIAAATEKGLCYVGSDGKGYDELHNWAAKKFPGSELIRDEKRLLLYTDELTKYLSGKLKQFKQQCHLQGTSFQQEVWHALSSIPYGETRSYSDIANTLNKPSAVRAVGTAIGANPVLITVPCHRVIGKSGALTGYRGGLAMKEKLLQLEVQSSVWEG